jgi:hypothetical protein
MDHNRTVDFIKVSDNQFLNALHIVNTLAYENGDLLFTMSNGDRVSATSPYAQMLVTWIGAFTRHKIPT